MRELLLGANTPPSRSGRDMSSALDFSMSWEGGSHFCVMEGLGGLIARIVYKMGIKNMLVCRVENHRGY